MLSRPLSHSVSQGTDTTVLNRLNVEYSDSIIDDILSDDERKIEKIQKCPTCKAVLSFKLLSGGKSGEFSCRLCEKPVPLQISNKYLSAMDGDNTYVMNTNKADLKAKYSTNVLIVICLDYSGSMEVSYNAPNAPLVQSFLQQKAGKPNFLSRKELLLISLEKQLKVLFDSDSKFTYQVFVITFDSDVLLYGQGRADPIPLKKELFNNMEECRKFGAINAEKVYDKKKSSDLVNLFDKLHKKECSGMTTLGPAVACGLGVIETLKPELSQFYVFTDGVANNGFGAMDENNLTESAIVAYKALGSRGLELGTIFHILGFEDEQSKIDILEELIGECQGSSLEKILTPEVKKKAANNREIIEHTYDEKQVNQLLRKALTVSSQTYGLLVKIKVLSLNSWKLKFCKECESDFGQKNKGEAVVLTKKLAAISDASENVSLKYQTEECQNKNIHVQLQLVFTKPSTGEKVFLVTNFSSELKTTYSYKDIDLNACNIVMIKDSFHENPDLCKNYIIMMYLCKYYDKNHSTFDEAEKQIRKLLEARFKEIAKNLFEDAERIALDMVKKTTEEASTKRKKVNEKIEEKNDGKDEGTIDNRKYKLWANEEASISRKRKKKTEAEEVKKEDQIPENKNIIKKSPEKDKMVKKKEEEMKCNEKKNSKIELLDDSDKEKTEQKKKIIKFQNKIDLSSDDEETIAGKKIEKKK